MNDEPATSLGEPRSRLHPSIVLSAYLEPIVRGRRVAILGASTSGLAEAIAERGARLLHVYDPDPARVAEALARLTPGASSPAGAITFATLAGDPGVRDGAFDVVIAADLTMFADPAEIVRRARRLVPANGVALFGAPNAGRLRPLLGGQDSPARALGYYELFDFVSLQFAKVRMLGQAPFVGYSVADFAPDGEPDVSIDTSLVGASEEPEHFLAIASDRPVTLDAYAVVALPWQDVAASTAPDPAVALALEGELSKARALVASEAEGRAATASRAAELEAEMGRRETKLKETEARAGDSHVRAERLTTQIRDLEEELVRQRDRGTKLTQKVDEEKRARTKAELELGMARGSTTELASAKERADALLAELESSRARIAELELEQVETRRRPLVSTPEPVAAPPPDPKLLGRIGELERAVDDALREAAKAAEQREASDRRAKDADGRAAALASAKGEAQRELAGLTARSLELGAQLAERDAALASRSAEITTLTRELAAAQQRAIELTETVSVTDTASQEIAVLEAALRERGTLITSLRRDLAESERIGRELVEDLSNGWSNGAAESPADDLRTRLDVLATSAARSEADLQAANWRITQLERQLAEAEGAPAEPSAVQLELEQALAAARDEVAQLRRASSTG